ncbi:hypothetical protein CFC21_108641 [Triticum aestivum]|uniref:Uncharacterized protein n=2 Tax=Triticum aestivum TaxID=4565 RepID=A0A3B6THG9_WHEAT|nr:hypothetical protein CFC21_108641 [Triticum aestivum]
MDQRTLALKMAADFPVAPVDRLHIFADEACSAAILMEMVQAVGPAEVHSVGGSRWGMVDAGVSVVAGFSGAAYGEQVRVDAGGVVVSDLNESEEDNADAFEQGAQVDGIHAMDSVIADQAESEDAASVHSTGKIDPQAPGWTRRQNNLLRYSFVNKMPEQSAMLLLRAITFRLTW